ncbi:lipooligosaccharide transport system permease protein [Nakamurella panacisegetis]|uniref:Transport permease protein n=1 Tax=Nakamurella panacisegetis TaxID=1090615 RepID=A0A1H0HUZ6_9ACTN|nr:ABC transporter permease [Nakamurella panacisegetis]SDO22959.1 lipooligosaccharide transport system permease protein [Nakamurella panacisegetis]
MTSRHLPTRGRGPSLLLLRVVPLHLYAGRTHVILERALRVYKQSWLAVVSGFFEPLFYLLAMGRGLGALVGPIHVGNGVPISYAAYIAPALLATSAMNGAVLDSTNNVFFKMKFAKLYDGMLATSLGPVDVALGEIIWSLFRGGLYSSAFVLVLLALGLLSSWWALLAVPVALLVAFGFAAVGMAVTSYMKTFQHLEWVTVALLPMFLFSTTFYPLGVYPRPIQLVVECLPLYHAIELMRGLCLGLVTPSLFLHLVYFAVMMMVGVAVASRRLERLLLR